MGTVGSILLNESSPTVLLICPLSVYCGGLMGTEKLDKNLVNNKQ